MAGCCVAHRGPSREARPRISQQEIEQAREDRKILRQKGDAQPSETSAQRNARRKEHMRKLETEAHADNKHWDNAQEARIREAARARARGETPLLA